MESNTTSKTKRLFIDTRNRTDEIKFDEPLINVSKIKLNYVQLHNSYSNVYKDDTVTFTTVDNLSKRTDITFNPSFREEAFYTIDDFKNILNLFLNQSVWPEKIKGNIQIDIRHDLSNNKVVITKEVKNGLRLVHFRITSKFLDRLGFRNTLIVPIPAESDFGVKLIPFTNYFLHCDLVDDVMHKGFKEQCKKSDIMCVLPVDQSVRWWNPVTYRNIGCTFKPNKKEINSIKLWITDEKGNCINFNDYPILYEMEITYEEPNLKCQYNIEPNLKYNDKNELDEY